jgi:hypothetical protein
MPGRKPPKYVPTLTDVVAEAKPAPPAADPEAREQLIQRIMQRVDMALERRMREAIAVVVMEQAKGLAPLLRDEIESVVRETVAQALADEIATGARRRS